MESRDQDKGNSPEHLPSKSLTCSKHHDQTAAVTSPNINKSKNLSYALVLQETGFNLGGWCTHCAEDAGIKPRNIEESCQNSSTNLHRSTSSNPTTSRSQLPFQRTSAIRLLASSVIPTACSTNISSIPTTSLSQHGHFQNVIKIKQRNTEETNFPKKKSTPSSPKAAKLINHDRLIDCGFVLHVNDELNKKTGIFNVIQLVNITNPNLFDDLMDTLWKLFVHKLSNSTEGINTSSEERNTSIKVPTQSCCKKSNVIAPSYSRPKASTSKSTVKKCESSDSINLSSDECVIFSKPST
ncbi:hypothetical protein MJO29_010067 [Puccinia striiformis f. sp. tritici]|nr:hypothetical protein MJO29_010067 [Puccinia striiformis f. sp. tritici]